MANVVWRRKTKKVYVYYYDTKQRKLVQIPREITKALDGLPREEVLQWVEDWEKDHGVFRDKIDRTRVKDDSKLIKLWAGYQSNRMKIRKRSEDTAKAENDAFHLYAVRFFVGMNRQRDPTKWHDLVPEFHNWLFEQPVKETYMKKILWALERFGKYLVFQRVMPYPFAIQIPARENRKVTPLKIRITPEDIFNGVRAFSEKDGTDINFKLAILLAYFASLRPSELFALKREDFLTGKDAVKHSKTYEDFQKYQHENDNLGSRLAVTISKAIVHKNPEDLPKTHYSYGVVTIWHPKAAEMIAEIVKELPKGRLFPFSRGWLDRAWRERVLDRLGSTPHDLRRASGLFLGRTIRVPLTLLQEHMRHSEIETTMLYTRDPRIPDVSKVSKQDFDDVV